MAQLAIKGHEYRGKEVIEILEMLGGKNLLSYFGDDDSAVYSIEGREIVIYELEAIKSEEYNVFTLEEFLEKFPYKVGDKVKVLANMYCGVFDIQCMAWYCVSKVVKYNILGYWLSAENLQPYKEEGDMEEKNNDNHIKWDLPVGYEFQDKEGNVINTDTIKLVKKQPQYPKTYEECCDVLGIDHENYPTIRNSNQDDDEVETTQYEQELLDDITYLWELKIYRDAYWKIAGEQMGLGKPWEPPYGCEPVEIFCVHTYQNRITRVSDNSSYHHILAFPTEEMRDAFYENFKGFIENCKMFL
jgi:hypothetical protein